MKTTPVLALIAMVLAAPAFAQEADPAIDVNGDGFYSFPELSAVFPDLTDEMFSAMDTTGDGLLDMAEVAAAVDAGLLPPMDG
ncbi:MAG: EF hand [Rhodobacteraceae bacterium HLUCCA08]|nr:MAG: EF hand [Rhodobacteraceae bacterium HLUCCA08]